jgi:hypothetical protein
MLFQIGDKLFKVETSRLTSRILSWRLCEYNNRWLQWQLDNSNEQTFSLLQIAFQDLVPIVEGEQQDFFDQRNAT